MKKYYFLLIALCITSFINAQIVTIPDPIFKAKLLAANLSNQIAQGSDIWNHIKIDTNNDGEIQESEALNVYKLDLNYSSFDGIGQIIDLTGIQSFSNLRSLSCLNNNIISIDISNLNNLESFFCNNNQITNLNVSNLPNLNTIICNSNSNLTLLKLSNLPNLHSLTAGFCSINTLNLSELPNLEEISLHYNLLTSLDVTNLPNLKSLICYNNYLSSLNISGLSNLAMLECSYNLLTSLNINNLTSLTSLGCGSNQISVLDVSNLVNLVSLICPINNIETLNVSGLTHLTSLYCWENNLKTLFIKNGVNYVLQYTYDPVVGNVCYKLYGNPNLEYVCADENRILDLVTYFNGQPNLQINSYCSFIPGGAYYTIQGNNKYDENNNGCDAGDIKYPNLKLSFSDGTNTGDFITNTTGSYHYEVQAGTQTITPSLENSSYFTVSPTTTTVTFPIQATPFTQDFCIVANGTHPDLEVSCMPLTTARPGFDATYKIVYKNKGTNTQSGTVNMTFDDAVLDLVSANPVAATVAVNNLSWGFNNLLPFETREITVVLNVNSPVETPAVNNGDILNYTTSITSTATDETPQDNTFVLNQTVINSLDPNDKTCLEGKTIAPSAIGGYVHYMIRFENNGTANAQNIVVKDIIDTTQFDVSSLIPIKGSHNFTTRISDTNKVEFIFQDINLPFDDANNDGYILFKIKTKPTLVTGNTFSNTASIYFDYNAPIVTNTATTTIQVLGTQDFDFDNYFTIYPNPAATVLNLSSKNTIELKSISIYNTLGQLVMVIPNAQDTKAVDVSQLTTGNYFIKMNTDKGVSVSKFLKK